MEPADEDAVILHVYELSAPEQQQGRGSTSEMTPSTPVSVGSFFQRFLTPCGYGAYHTSLQLHGYCYTFGAGSGIYKYPASAEPANASISTQSSVPGNAVYKESIPLGICPMSRGEVNECLQRLRTHKFTNTAYHLLNRNCNHFTETFATALIQCNELLSGETVELKSYPAWVNRLSKTGTAFIDHGDVCNILEEAKFAVGTDRKVGWEFSSKKDTKQSSTNSRSEKKELTAKQKAILAKIKGSSKG